MFSIMAESATSCIACSADKARFEGLKKQGSSFAHNLFTCRLWNRARAEAEAILYDVWNMQVPLAVLGAQVCNGPKEIVHSNSPDQEGEYSPVQEGRLLWYPGADAVRDM